MNPKIAEAHHRDPYLHEFVVTVLQFMIMIIKKLY